MDYSLIFHNHTAVKLLIDPNTGEIKDANKAAIQFYGYSREEILSMHIQDINTLNDVNVRQKLQQATSNTQNYFEFWHRLASGEVKPVDVWATRIDMPEGPIVHSIVIDASQKRQSELKYRALFQQSNDAVFIIDLNGQHMDVNQRACNLLGYSRDELLGMSYRDSVYEAEISKSEEILLRLIAGEQLQPYERIFRHHDDRLIPTEVNVEVVHNSQGQPEFIQSIVRDISDRKQAEKNMQRTQEHLGMTLDATLSGTWEWNVVTGETVFNERWAEIVGYTLDELQPISIQTWFDLTHPDDLQESNRLLEEHFAEDSTYYEYEARMRHKDGHWVWILDRGMVMEWTDDGKPLLMFGTHTDITTRKAMETQLRDSEERLRTIVDNIPVMISFFDNEGQFEFSNQHWNASLGWTASELVQFADPLSVFYPDESYRQKVLDYMLQAESGWRTFEIHTKNNGIRLTSWANVRLSDGRSIGIGQDITERVASEKAILEKKEELERFFSLVLDLLCIAEPNGHLVKVNQAWETILGYPLDTLADKSFIELVHPDDLEQTLIRLTELNAGNSVIGFVNRYRHYDETYRLFQWSAQQVGDLIYASARDITQQKKAEEQVFAYQLEKERVNILARFIRDASHEFRTPLAVIQTSLYILSKTENPQKRRDKANLIYAQVQRLTKLLDMLVTMSKLDSGIELDRQPVDLQSIIQSLLYELSQPITDKKLSVSVINTLSQTPLTNLDESFILEAFKQVLDNAIRHTPDEGQIIIRSSIEQNNIIVDIENNGDPIPEDILPHIFERFFRQDDAHTTSGIGLGLSIAYSVIEQHNGRIEVTNINDNCRVRIILPINQQ